MFKTLRAWWAPDLSKSVIEVRPDVVGWVWRVNHHRCAIACSADRRCRDIGHAVTRAGAVRAARRRLRALARRSRALSRGWQEVR